MRWLLALSASWILLSAPAHAQTASAGMLARTYTLADPESVRLSEVSVVSAPFSAVIPVTARAVLAAGGAYSHAALTLPSGQRVTASGITDTHVAAELRAAGLTLRGTVLLPTGDVVQSLDQAAIVGVLSSDLLPFRIARWGSGGGVGADLSYSRRIRSSSLAVTMGYLGLGESDPFATGNAAYRPGREVHARATLRTGVGRAGALTLAGGLQIYSSDTYDGQELFRPGLRWDAVASYAFPLSRSMSGAVVGGIYDRSATKAAADTLLGTSIPGAVGPASRRVLLAGAEIRIPTSTIGVVPWTEIRIVRSGETRGQGWLFSLGARADYRLWGDRFGRRLSLHPSAAFRLGRTEPEAGLESGVSGWEAGAVVTWEMGP